MLVKLTATLISLQEHAYLSVSAVMFCNNVTVVTNKQYISVSSLMTTFTFLIRQIFIIEPLFLNTTSGMHRRSFEGRHLVWKIFESSYIPKSIPSVCLSVCTTIFKWIAGLCFYIKSLMFYINGFILSSIN